MRGRGGTRGTGQWEGGARPLRPVIPLLLPRLRRLQLRLLRLPLPLQGLCMEGILTLSRLLLCFHRIEMGLAVELEEELGVGLGGELGLGRELETLRFTGGL